MMHVFKRAWADVVLPILQRPRRLQVAALCYRDTPEGRKVLLITSRDTGRWIVPKGWPIDGLDGPGTALQEAWEEAGVRDAVIRSEPHGLYYYDKRMDGGHSLPVEVQVYLAEVSNLEAQYPEADERTRAWFTPFEAAERVDEPELAAMLRIL